MYFISVESEFILRSQATTSTSNITATTTTVLNSDSKYSRASST
jgi:hypothetical protein